jgi:hypothetical protein
MASKKRRRRTGGILLTYNYHGVDPVVHELHEMWKRSGATMVELSGASGVSTTTLHRWFHGGLRRSPLHDRVEAVRRALGVDVRYHRGREVMAMRGIRCGLRYAELHWHGQVILLPQRVRSAA